MKFKRLSIKILGHDLYVESVTGSNPDDVSKEISKGQQLLNEVLARELGYKPEKKETDDFSEIFNMFK